MPTYGSQAARLSPPLTLSLGGSRPAFRRLRPRRKAAVEPAAAFPRDNTDLARLASPVSGTAEISILGQHHSGSRLSPTAHARPGPQRGREAGACGLLSQTVRAARFLDASD